MIKTGFIKFSLLTLSLILAQAGLASAQIEITDFYSDFTSSDVTLFSQDRGKGTIVFEILYGREVVETQRVPVNLTPGKEVTKVIVWQTKPQHDYYTANASVYVDSKLIAQKSYPFTYGTSALPPFHIVDFSPGNSGVLLLLRPFNPSVVDIKIELLDGNDVVDAKTLKDISLIQPREISLNWPFLLEKDKKYLVRAKTYSHRLYSQPLINTYIASFTALEDVEILGSEVEVDEYGASITLRGKSQVPFDGILEIVMRNRETNATQTYRKIIEEVLTSGKEKTVGVVWENLPPGVYDVKILALNQENEVKDKYETVLRMPAPPPIKTPAIKRTPGFLALFSILTLILIRFFKKHV